MNMPKKAWILLGIATVIAIIVAFFEWNWLRSPLATYLSGRVGRPVAIEGNLQGEWSWKPLFSANSVTIRNASWSSEPVMAQAQRVDVRVDVAPLLSGPVSLPEVTLVAPEVLLERGPDGHANWELPGPSDSPRNIPVIGRLNI